MHAQQTSGQGLAKGPGRFVGHVFAIVLGLILSVTGLAMGVSIALLPVGIPVGLLGLVLLLWGLLGGGEEMKVPPFPPM